MYTYVEPVRVGIQRLEFNAYLDLQLQLYTRLDYEIISRTGLAKNKQAVPTVQHTRVCTYTCVCDMTHSHVRHDECNFFFGEFSFEFDGEYPKDAGGCYSDSSDL